ncbi:MAG: SdrD B-like domain-containing protein [Roseiflexaceae bacterium]|nr:SdrD B-like domain-containing protein [Roseiflexaceae bacterium]
MYRKRSLSAMMMRLVLLAVIAISALPFSSMSQSTPVAYAATSTLHLSVMSADDSSATFNATPGNTPIQKGDPITQFKYIINIDNTGTTTQRSPVPGSGCSPADNTYPDSCKWVGVAGRANNSPVYTQGNQDDFISGLFTINGQAVTLPDGRYLISVLADNYKIDGAHFSVPFTGSDLVTVLMQPYDLPDATVQAAVFEDMTPTNSAPDVPGERGLAGFVGHIKDYIDEVTTDVYGGPICGNGQCVSKCYVVANGIDIGTVAALDSFGRCPIAFTRDEDPLIPFNRSPITQTAEGDPIPVGAEIEGKVVIPNMGPNRYALSVVPPNNSGWIQTTTLEGNHDWDAWVMEGATGLDTEFVVGGEPFPATFFGYVLPTNRMGTGANRGTIKGVGLAVSAYIPPTGGIPAAEGVFGSKPKDKNPIHRLFVSLSDLNNSDQTVFVGEFDCNMALGCPAPAFSIPNVPAGDYVLGIWDEPQDYIFGVQNVSVKAGETVDLGALSLVGWWTTIEGHVFNDLNENGKRDAGEPGIPNFFISMRTRENSVMDRGTVSVTTDANGYYWMESAYPMTQWLVEEAYADGFQTTGITYQADNQPTETTVLGQGVDVNVHPVIGLGGRMDWGVKAYAPGTNGGIVGTISYDTTRNELNPQYAAIEDWQPSIADLTVELRSPVLCGTHTGTPCDETGLYELAPSGAYALGKLLNTYVSETWERPSGCIARNVNGTPLQHGIDENVLPTDPNAPCLEAPMMGVQFGPLASDVGTPDENFGASVDGNYGFGDGCFTGTLVATDPANPVCNGGTFQPLTANRDYLVTVVIPDDALGRPMYQVTREEDINIANGDSFIPQVPPPSCAGALHTVDVAGMGTDGYPAVVGNDITLPIGVTVPASTPTDNATFVGIGGSVYEGQQKPLCDTKLVHVSDRKSIAPGFNFFTDVPLPGRFWGLIVDDLNYSTNPKQTGYGEKMGIPFAPVGIYDYTNRLITTAESDYNGLFDVLLPSTNRISCPTPSGVCANLYRFVGNDPGVPGHWNANYTPQYRTIAAEFEAFPGLTIPADLAPTQVAVSVQIPGTQTLEPIFCTQDAAQPQLLAVSKPYANLASAPDSFTIDGFGFGSATGQVLLDTTPLPTTSWADGHIAVTVPIGTANGVHQLSIKASNGNKTINGLTFHVFGSTTVSPSPFPSNAAALDAFTDRTALGSNWSVDAVILPSVFTVINNSGTNNDYLRIQTGTNNTVRNAWWNSAFGTSQEAYLTYTQYSGNPGANEQGLLLKYNGVLNANLSTARWIEVAVDNNNVADPEGASVRVRTKLGNAITEQLEITGVTFSNGDQLGARALNNGTIIVYKNGSEIGRVTVGATAAMSGRIGLRFEGTGTSSTIEARVDNFGGGNVTLVTNTGNTPSLFEVGPGHPFATIQSAIDASAAQTTYKDSLVVVYPGTIDPTNPRYNGRGAYYENPIMYAPVQLQGVGSGGVRPDGSIVQGSIIDGIAFGGDTTLALNWLGKVSTLTWDGNQDINDGQVIYILASNTTNNGAGTVRPTLTQAGSFNSLTFKPMIDGFNIRGGDQQGLPGNLNAIFGGFPGPIAAVQIQTQGGAIFANAYVKNLQVTNNVIEGNGGSYGAIRIGTPNLPNDPATPLINESDNQNDNLRIANNRILANGGTNLAGAIGLFNGADGYEIDHNDLCGNFSAEYGGAISHFGLSGTASVAHANGSSLSEIHDNRIYFNHSYDEGAGIMIAGELPANPGANYNAPGGPVGSGPVDIYNNLIQANLSDDDGGGMRFLMAGNFPMNVYNNMIVNNVSTHEGGGVALDDAPSVRFYNNTVMNNKTTATAITSNGQPAPAGLSTGPNSVALQATLPSGSSLFSNPLLFNNIFWDNRAGTKGTNTVIGIGTTGDATPINNWDMGVVGSPGSLLEPTNSVIQQNAGTYPYTASASNSSANPAVTSVYNIPMTFTSWRTNINFVGAIMVTTELPPTLMGNYHLQNGIGAAFPAVNSGAASKTVGTLTVTAPTFDIDRDARPALGGFDSGADEVRGLEADLSITKNDGVTSVNPGATLTYTIVASNAGPDAASATVADTIPANLTNVSWTCSGTSCPAANGTGSINAVLNLPVGGSVTYTVNATVAANAAGSVINTATIAVGVNTSDPNLAHNSATDTDTIPPPLPTLTVLDSFNRANANTLNNGTNWSQIVLFGSSSIRVNNNQAFATLLGWAMWNAPATGFGTQQGAAFTFANTPVDTSALFLKASSGSANTPQNYLRVQYRTSGGGQVVVGTTTNTGVSFTTIGTFAATFAATDRLTARANADGSVDVWKTTSANVTTYLGHSSTSSFTGSGRIGIYLSTNARVDDFRGGTLP